MNESVKKKIWPAIRRRPVLAAALLFSLLSAVYWSLIASDRYVSEAHVIIQRTDLSSGAPMDLTSLLGAPARATRATSCCCRTTCCRWTCCASWTSS